jgi:hypothetical protein
MIHTVFSARPRPATAGWNQLWYYINSTAQSETRIEWKFADSTSYSYPAHGAGNGYDTTMILVYRNAKIGYLLCDSDGVTPNVYPKVPFFPNNGQAWALRFINRGTQHIGAAAALSGYSIRGVMSLGTVQDTNGPSAPLAAVDHGYGTSYGGMTLTLINQDPVGTPPIFLVGLSNSAIPNQATVAPPHQPGDLIFHIGERPLVRGLPPAPAGFTELFNSTNSYFQSNSAMRVSWKIADSTSLTIAAWGGDDFGTDQSRMFVFRNAAIGAVTADTDGLAPLEYPAITPNPDDQTAHLLRIVDRGARWRDSSPAPGMILLHLYYDAVLSYSDGAVGPVAAVAPAGGINALHKAWSIELVNFT